MSPNAVGALLMTVSAAAFVFNDTMIKAVTAQLPLFQVMTLRGLLGTVIIFILARQTGRLVWRLPRRDWGLIALRCAAEVGATLFFLTALMNLPLANITAVMQALPLTVTLAALLFFREPVGWRRLSAILIGFGGVLLIVRPGPDGFSIDSVYVLAAVACVTVRDLSTRRMSAGVPSMTVTLAGMLSVTLFSAVVSVGIDWAPVEGRSGLLIAGAAGAVLVGYLTVIQAMRVGEVSAVTPFRYSGILWALFLGLAVFGDWPDLVTMAGVGIVVGSGLFTLYRERKVSPGV
jgi:S-adenosylmethionine uptake transporter